MATITDKDQALRTLEQLGTFIMTKKAPLVKEREAFSEDVLKTLSLYKTKLNKADMPSQYNDIVEAAKYEIKTVFDAYQE